MYVRVCSSIYAVEYIAYTTAAESINEALYRESPFELYFAVLVRSDQGVNEFNKWKYSHKQSTHGYTAQVIPKISMNWATKIGPLLCVLNLTSSLIVNFVVPVESSPSNYEITSRN